MGGSPPKPRPVVVEKPVDPEIEVAKAREKAVERRRRGLAGLITTSLLGLADEPRPGRKTLLGE